MSMISELLEAKEYDFLRDFISNERLILLVVGGSRAYGTNVDTSDLDLRGIALNSPQEILTMSCRDKPLVNTETDTTIYYLKQIITLLSNCNPNTVELLGTRQEEILYITEEGRLLRKNADLFLSKKAGHSFGGYAISQLRRLQNSLARDNYPQAEKEEHILQILKRQDHHIQENYASLGKYDINMYLDKSNKIDFDKEVFVDFNLKHYPLRDLRSISNEFSSVLKDYDSLNHRNNKKTSASLNKHVCHLIRLLLTGAEILEGKGIRTYREDDLDLLMKLRNGDFVKEGDNYSDIFKMIDQHQKRFDYAMKHSELPEKPNYDKINELVATINKELIINEN